jgi:signal transduction histidine kinase
MKIRFDIKITLLYIITGCLWIIFSDKALLSMGFDITTYNLMQTYKGWFYVLATGFLLFLLTRGELEKRDKINKQLSVAKDKAEESERLKSAFLANLSHEIRTPMNSIVGFTELLKDPHTDHEKKDRFLTIITEKSHHLLKLLNNIIDLSRIQEKQLEIKSSRFDLNEMLSLLYREYFLEINTLRKKTIRLEYLPGLPDSEFYVTTDPLHLRQVLDNLIQNAIKFTSSGSVKFGYTLKDPNGHIEFFVEDSGPGLPGENPGQIFERFNRGDASDQKKGSGLGLAISKGLVDLMGGRIWAENTHDRGARFTFSIPTSKRNGVDFHENKQA